MNSKTGRVTNAKDDLQEPVVREAKARLQEKYRAAQQLGEEVSTIQKRK